MERIFVILALVAGISFYGDFNYSSEADKIASNFLKEIKNELKIYPAAIGGGVRGEVNLVSLHLTCYQRVDLEQAREILVQISEGLFARFNNHKKIRPYLHHFPFGAESLNILIAFKEAASTRVSEDYVALVEMKDKEICFCKFNHNSGKFYNIHFENYAEAKKLIEQKRK